MGSACRLKPFVPTHIIRVPRRRDGDPANLYRGEICLASTRPLVGRQDLGAVPPATMVVLSTFDCVQSAEAVPSIPSHNPDTLSPSFIVKGFAVRAQ